MCLGSPFIVFLNGFGNFSSLLILKNDKGPWFWRSTKVLDSDVNYGNRQRPEYFPNNYKDRSPGASEMLCLERSAKQCSLEILGRVQKDTFHITASFVLKSGFHIVVSVVRMNSICPMNFFRTTDTTDTTDTTIWKPGLRINIVLNEKQSTRFFSLTF